MGKKLTEKKGKNDEDQESSMSAKSMENLKIKEKTDLIRFVNEQLNTPVVFYSTYYRKHGYNILQRNYHKKGAKNKKEEGEDETEDKEENNSDQNTKNTSSEKKVENTTATAPVKDADPTKTIVKEQSIPAITYSKKCNEVTCYFDLKKKAHAFPMKWYEAHKTYNEYQQIPRTTKEININAENDRNTNFALFNRQNLNKSKWEKMDRNMQAKYYIYENPLPDIQNYVVNARKRNILYERNIREQIKRVYGTEPTVTELNEMIEKQRQEYLEASQKANQRLKEQFHWQLDTRNSDLQHLLEGQQTALDAIRLKEYLLLKPIPVRSNLNISNKDKRRLGSLLSSRYI